MSIGAPRGTVMQVAHVVRDLDTGINMWVRLFGANPLPPGFNDLNIKHPTMLVRRILHSRLTHSAILLFN